MSGLADAMRQALSEDAQRVRRNHLLWRIYERAHKAISHAEKGEALQDIMCWIEAEVNSANAKPTEATPHAGGNEKV